jgi:adenylate cyclase
MPPEGENPKVSRRLAAILAADIAGYSALMSADEEATVSDLKAHQAVILPMIGQHGGRIIDTAGDGILAEFGSVVNALKCAVAIQKTMAERNAGVEAERRMQFRIGVNLGDVIYDDARVYGDGVNIAARLESVAEPGGICVSGEAHAQVHRKLPIHFIDLGEQHLKNITQSVRVYRIEPTQTTTAHLIEPNGKPSLALPDKPAIAVLPFTNLSGDKEQEYFSDGITEDIITELSRFSELFVIARNSTFQYKGKFPDIRQVGRELGVRYVLEGSIRRAGDRVRVAAQLIDATTGAHRWAERYDRELKDVFAVQDEVARTIVTILAAHVNKAEVERTLLKPPTAWLAHDYYMRAAGVLASLISVEQLNEARRLLQQALSIDPSYARAYVLLSFADFAAWINLLDTDYLDPAVLDRAYQSASNAVRLDANLPEAHAQLGWVLCRIGEHDRAIAEFQRAMALNPNFTDWRYGANLLYAGEPTRAVQALEGQLRADPFYSPLVPGWLGLALYMLERYEDALTPLRECASRAPSFRWGHLWLAANYAKMGRVQEARSEAAEALRIHPQWTINGFGKPAHEFRRPADAEHFFDGLRIAGLPEN